MDETTLERPPVPDGTETSAREYLLVADKTSEVIRGGTDYNELKKLANTIRRAGGEVTMFKSMEA
jgi:hypothetical protein